MLFGMAQYIVVSPFFRHEKTGGTSSGFRFFAIVLCHNK